MKQYNILCQEINLLIEQNAAPRGALRPIAIEQEGLWRLNVDDDIWQDIGLDDELGGLSAPLWLIDDDIRKGIRLLLQLDRCMEEESRLRRERCVMQEWMIKRWDCVQAQLAVCGKSFQASLNLLLMV